MPTESDDDQFFADMRALGGSAEVLSTTNDPLAAEIAEATVDRMADKYREEN